ncbi:type II toxin-antitoxin system VapC family toxin [Maribellus mangrovi]|uniref:type II toxin-antitoxin system VapC family toxin n=1 Tax=Maribellus mangrovi TaxID=3133146 RepID=UPI0030EBC088
MNGNSLLIDTNIILYLLSGEETLIPILEEKQLFISFITELELLAYPGIKESDKTILMSFIRECKVIDIPNEVKTQTIDLRKKFNAKLPDAIIAATSLYINSPLVTADKGFRKMDSHIDLILYEK